MSAAPLPQLCGHYLEQRLLGILLANPDLIPQANEIALEEIGDPMHRRILEAIRRTQCCDVATLATELGEPYGNYLLNLLDRESFSPENLDAYVRSIKSAWKSRLFEAMVKRLQAHTVTGRLF